MVAHLTEQQAAVRRFSLLVPGIPLGSNDRAHWAKRAKDTARFRDLVHWQAWEMKPAQPLARSRVTVTLIHARFFDVDGAYSHVKPLVDGLKGSLIADDRYGMCEIVVTQERGKVRSCRIVVEEVS